MHYSAVAALMILTTVVLSACEQQQKAVLEDRSQQYYGRSGGYALASASTIGAPTVQAAAVDSISASDLGATAPAAVLAAPAAAAPAIMAAPVTWQWPVQGPVTASFGKQREGIANEGMTIAATKGTPIHAAADGEVAFVGNALRDYGNMVILRHANGDMSSYAHAESITVAKGMTVKQGDTVGYVGQSGSAKSPQLHFAVRSGERAVDPLSKLPSQYARR